MFPIPTRHHKFVLQKTDEPPLEFPDGTTPVAERVIVYGTHTQSPNHIPPSVTNSYYMEEVIVQVCCPCLQELTL